MFKGFKPEEGKPVQFLGVYALNWPWESNVEPTMAFVEMGAECDAVMEALGELYEDWVESGLDNRVFTEKRITKLMRLYDDWLE